MQAKVVRSILEHCGHIVRASFGHRGRTSWRSSWPRGTAATSRGARRPVGLLQELDALDPSVTTERAVDTLSATTDASFALLLQDAYGWSLDAIEAWITATNRSLLLGRR